MTAQLTTGTLSVDSTNPIWWSGSTFEDNVIVGQYQDSMHVADSDGNQLDTIHSVHNTKYVDAAHVSIDGLSSSALPIATGSCGLKFTFTSTSSVQTSGAKVYIYDGVEDINPAEDLTFQIAEGGESTVWTDANGLNDALALQDQDPATTHDFYVATSISPQTSGLKSGKIKIILSYI